MNGLTEQTLRLQANMVAILISHSKDAAKDLGFLLLDRNKQGDDVKIRKEDYKFTDLKNHSQIFLKDDDESIYTNPYYVHDIRMTGAQHVGTSSIESSFSTLVGTKKRRYPQTLQHH